MDHRSPQSPPHASPQSPQSPPLDAAQALDAHLSLVGRDLYAQVDAPAGASSDAPVNAPSSADRAVTR
ncbi:hypothetical protein [Sorangium sp. So ce1097]|uniref:hypothetical protein n=1 Tax=Sorangium sp. So ce1097 TaxID=3133330 RepID=UPI003F61DBAC